MKLFFDLIPVLLFFIAYEVYDIYVATAVAIGASALQVLWQWIRLGKPEKMVLITFGLLTFFGGLTLILHDPDFIKWKPTIINWLFGLICIGSIWIGEKNILEKVMGHAAKMPQQNWHFLNLATALFFIGIGILNLYVAFSFPEDIWVKFKLFGLMGLTLVFSLALGVYVFRHAEPLEEK